MENNKKTTIRVANHPVKEITKLFINNITQTTGFTSYTGQPDDDYTGYRCQAVVVFDDRPKGKRKTIRRIS